MANAMGRKWIWAGAGLLGGVAFARWQFARWFTGQTHYALEQRLSGDFEIRTYGAHWVAETTVSDASWEEALSEGFRRLARYIFGDNRPSPFQPDGLGKPGAVRPALAVPAPADEHDSGYVIPMPAPTVGRRVPRRETLPMTSPVNVTTHDDRSYTIAFNLPECRTLASLPSPNDERVRLERRPRRRVAVLRYRGPHSGPRVAQKFSELLARVRAAGLGHRGSPEFAGYDPLSTLPFLRRNEVWVELDPR
jgi:hypothetical protein